uniref:Uncharacterized protein n=1 Tax=Chromera velia CCMP2878 TaxID=1169474 RepID=A0A0G4FIT3_9ALVE|eukprot:Cvel_17248.t1-p1 / transcript=Cvel_17248.t1 / gene=Cvel_17248 / organism=Chromera_velia_CCMP2878 / gene_product=hypothetical protein / transcript_product=hypothetical protein / location=Cvel_scaffold1366:2744-3814(+) / protein_length=85 / sequence_SO=supercontig / SO=protein_coding / is_pseudo=false
MSNRVESVRKNNGSLREENSVLRDYLENLTMKMSQMTNVGSSGKASKVKLPPPPPKPGKGHTGQDVTYAIKVSDKIGELAQTMGE